MNVFYDAHMTVVAYNVAAPAHSEKKNRLLNEIDQENKETRRYIEKLQSKNSNIYCTREQSEEETEQQKKLKFYEKCSLVSSVNIPPKNAFLLFKHIMIMR